MNIKQLKQLPKVSQLTPGQGAEFAPGVNVPGDTQQPPINLNTPGLQDQINALAELRAEEIVRDQQQARILARNGRTFTKFDAVGLVSKTFHTS